MRLLPVDQIVIPPDRIRKEFDGESLHELSNSIAAHGLFHALLVRNDGVTLVAGERRLRAVTKLAQGGLHYRYDNSEVPQGQVPTVRLGDHDAMALLEAELHENSVRRNLTWQEQARATAALQKLKQALNPDYGITHLQKEIAPTKANFDGVKSDLIVAEFLDDPEVAGAKTRKEALTIVERKLVGLHREKLAAEFGVLHQNKDQQLMHGDLFELLPKFPDHYFDCIVADPPYGIDADAMANQSAVRHTYDDSSLYSNRVYQFIAAEGWRLTKNEAHIYLFCDSRRFGSLSGLLTAAGWDVWPWLIHWWKGSTNVGLLPRPEHGPRRTYESLIYGIKGNRRVTGVYPDIIVCPHDRTTERGGHKPVELYRDLISRSCFPGDRVLDPCCGTGPVFDAAKSQNVFAVGIELEAAAYAQALQRIRGEAS